MSVPFSPDPVSAVLNHVGAAHGSLNVYPDAREAGGTFVPVQPSRRGGGIRGQASDPKRSGVPEPLP